MKDFFEFYLWQLGNFACSDLGSRIVECVVFGAKRYSHFVAFVEPKQVSEVLCCAASDCNNDQSSCEWIKRSAVSNFCSTRN